MTNPRPLTASERSARDLLAAWNSGELVRLAAALKATGSSLQAQLQSSEAERVELVRDIADIIRVWLEGAKPDAQTNLRVSLKLLRHLARCEDVRDTEGIASEIAQAPAGVPKQAPQSETLAFVQR